MNEITYYTRGKGFVYWVVPVKRKLGGGVVKWGWKIVGAQLRDMLIVARAGKAGFEYVAVSPNNPEFDCNPHHIELPAYVFQKKKEAEGWLKLTCERWEPEG